MTDFDSPLTIPLAAEPLLHIVLVAPEIPANTGNIGRTCVALGAKLWLVKPLGFQVDDYNLRRAGLDYWKLLDWEVVNTWQEAAEKLAGRTFWFLTKSGQKLYTEVFYRQGDVLVFGNESSGLPPEILEPNRATALRIPNTAGSAQLESQQHGGCGDV